jgi:hypothetical protein
MCSDASNFEIASARQGWIFMVKESRTQLQAWVHLIITLQQKRIKRSTAIWLLILTNWCHRTRYNCSFILCWKSFHSYSITIIKKRITYQANTLPNPRAVMVKSFYTVIAYWTMGAARWSVKHASITILDFHSHSIEFHLLNAWQA